MANKRAIVTGGSGFIGSALVRKLVLEEGYSVLNYDAMTYAATTGSTAAVADHPAYNFIKGDITDQELFSKTLKTFRPTVVFHLAAESHVDRSIDGPAAFIDTNVVGTQRLLSATMAYWDKLPAADKDAFRFLHISTDEVYGSLGFDDPRFDEDSKYQPNSPYSASKAGSDMLVRAWHRTYGFPALITNCSNNYGPYQFPEKLIPTVLINVLEQRPIPVYGDGSNIRDWVFVGDHVNALHKASLKGEPGQVYLIGGGEEHSNLEVVKRICRVVDRLTGHDGDSTDLITFVGDRPGHDLRYAIDDENTKKALEWQPDLDFDAGLEQTIQWYLDNRPWWQDIRAKVYDGSRLGTADKKSDKED